jgi:nitrilase
MTEERPFIVASAQLAPVFLDRKRTIDKACEAIGEAAKNGAKIVVFPEVFVPGYPDWVWVLPASDSAHRELYGELLDQSVTIPSLATEKLCKAAKAAGVHVVIGVNERNSDASGGSIYNTLLYIDGAGEIMGRHRKLVPTMAERLVWAPGNGSTLDAYDTPYGKLGGLICWENYMPLARYAMYAWGVNVYVAATWDSSDGWVGTLQHIAREGRCAVIGCCIAMTREQVPDRLGFKALYPEAETEDDQWVNSGNSAIVAPGGKILAGPAFNRETILYAEITPASLREAKFSLDAAGHYARPDVFQLTINRDANEMINMAGHPPATNGKVSKAPARTRRKA